MIDAVVLDMDGLILDTERLQAEEVIRVREELGLATDEALLTRSAGLPTDAWVALFRENCGEELFPRFVDHMLAYFEKYHHAPCPVKKGFYELMEYLKKEGLKVAVATATEKEGAEAALKNIGALELLDALVTGDMVARNKPHPDIYLEACRRLGVAPQNAMALEDSPSGLRSALGAGMPTVMVPDMAPCPPEIECLLFAKADSLLDVIGLLERIRGGSAQ